MSAVDVREAVEADVEAIAALAKTHRNRLARWSPMWWRKAEGADELHPLWLRHLVVSNGAEVKVVAWDNVVVGCAVVMPQHGQYFVDDLAVDDERWGDAGQDLLNAIEHRPALTCIATQDRLRAEALIVARLSHVSSYWIRLTEPSGEATPPEVVPISGRSLAPLHLRMPLAVHSIRSPTAHCRSCLVMVSSSGRRR